MELTVAFLFVAGEISRLSLARKATRQRGTPGLTEATQTELTEATMADNPFEERAEPNPFQVRDDTAPAPSLSAFLRSWSKLYSSCFPSAWTG